MATATAKKPRRLPAALIEHRAWIVRARATLNRPNTFGQNIINTTLRIIERDFGRSAVNNAVRELGLKRHGWNEQPE